MAIGPYGWEELTSAAHTRIWEHINKTKTEVVSGLAQLVTPWTTFTPQWQQTGGAILSIGNGNISGRYMRIGKLGITMITMTRGSTTNLGMDGQSWLWPLGQSSTGEAYGAGHAKRRAVIVDPVTADLVALVGDGERVDTAWPGTATWNVGDLIRFIAFYPVA